MTRFWTGEPVEYRGSYFQVEGARQLPVPLSRIPVVVGGTGPATMELVARYADWWNVPMHQLDRLASARPGRGEGPGVGTGAGHPGSPTPPAGTRWSSWPPGVSAGWGSSAHLVGTVEELVPQVEAFRADGVERLYTWFTDFALPETLSAFGREVIATVG